MGKYITVTGYYGSGSSAVMDLLMEYSCNGSKVMNKIGGYEHTTLYHPGGLFDLEDKLLIGNDMYRSNEAIRTFRKEMLRLNKYNFGWYGSFGSLFGNQFKDNLDKFIDSFKSFELNEHYYGQCKKVIFNPFKIPLQLGARIFLGRTIYKWGRQFIYDSHRKKLNVIFPDDKEFYAKAKIWINNYMEMYRENGKDNILFDRLVLCQHLYRIPNYFDEDFRVIRVRRDIRDIYVLNNYIWKQINTGTMYPFGVDNFVEFWKQLNNNEKEVKDDRILDIYFEDLIYNYEDTVKKIEIHCGLNTVQHEKKFEHFKPDKSIKNTQVFNLRDEWKDEIRIIEKELPEYLYVFPYRIETNIDLMFDDSTTNKKNGLIKRK